MTRRGRLGSPASKEAVAATRSIGFEFGSAKGVSKCPRERESVLRYDRPAAAALPVQVARHADHNDSCSPERLGGPRDDRVQRPRGANQHVDRRQPGIARTAVRTWNIRTLPAQPE